MRHEPFNVMSCDNLADNGHRLRRAVLEFVRTSDPALAEWIEAEVPFPCTMVDSITPATDDALRSRVKEPLAWKIAGQCSGNFSCQWVIENKLRGAAAGLGQRWRLADRRCRGLRTRQTAIVERRAFHARLRRQSRGSRNRLRRDERCDAVRVYSSHDARRHSRGTRRSGGLDLDQYIEAMLRRFRNPTIRHLLSQIAWDGSQKLPFRILPTITENLAAGRSISRLCVPLAAWFHFIRRQVRHQRQIFDPLAAQLTELAQRCNGDPSHDVATFLVTGESVQRGSRGERVVSLQTGNDLCAV